MIKLTRSYLPTPTEKGEGLKMPLLNCFAFYAHPRTMHVGAVDGCQWRQEVFNLFCAPWFWGRHSFVARIPGGPGILATRLHTSFWVWQCPSCMLWDAVVNPTCTSGLKQKHVLCCMFWDAGVNPKCILFMCMFNILCCSAGCTLRPSTALCLEGQICVCASLQFVQKS